MQSMQEPSETISDKPGMRALFVYTGQNNYSYTLSTTRDYHMKREVQIGFAYLCAALRQANIDSEIIDGTLTPMSPSELVEYARKKAPLFVGFYAAAALKEQVVACIQSLRQALPGMKVLVGGPDTYDCDSYLAAGADAYCLGEGDETIIELWEYCSGRLERKSIRGIAYRENGVCHYTAPRPQIENLDRLPLPAWDKFDLTKYYDYHVFDMRVPYTSIMASRGCSFRCSYCISHKLWGNRYRSRTANNVLKEIDYLVKTLGVRYIMFQDDIWSWNDDDFARVLCRGLLDRQYDLKWRCILHPFSFRKNREEMLTMMKSAGCSSITTGLQSASAQILRNIHRSPEEPEALFALVQIMKKIGILNNTAFIFGLPGETEATMEESIRYALRLRPTFCAFYKLALLPGSELWEQNRKGTLSIYPETLLDLKCSEAARRFYSSPAIITQLIYEILRTNPFWLFRAMSSWGTIASFSGFWKKKSAQKSQAC